MTMRSGPVAPYSLEIYAPGSTDDVWVVFESTTAFMTISVGDLVNPGIWDGSRSPQKVLRAINVEHIIWQAGGVAKHKVCVYTEEVDGTRELRLHRKS